MKIAVRGQPRPETISLRKEDILPPEKKESKEAWNDRLEAVQFLTRVYSRFRDKGERISSDFVLARLDERQRNFIIESTKQAFALRRQIPDRDVANRMFDTIMVESMMLAILHRNIERNTLMNIVGGVREEEDNSVAVKQESVLDALKSKIGMGPKTDGGVS